MRHRDVYDFKNSNRLINLGVGSEAFFQEIEKSLTPVVSRAEASRITGGLISAKTLSNEDSLRKGPQGRVRVGSKIGYTRESFMTYLRRKIRQL